MTSLYKISVPMMIKGLENFKGFLAKGEEHFKANGADLGEMAQTRLIEDMKGLDYQVQSCSNTAKFVVSRVGGREDVHFPDDEKTFAQLQARLDRTIELLREAPEDCMDGKEDAEVLMATPSMGTFRFTGYNYVVLFAIPNFHFHLSTGYCILRRLGVPVGAMDYIDPTGALFEKVE